MTIETSVTAPISLRIDPTGAHRFSYTKVENATGEAVWQWPNKPTLSTRIEAKGQLLDVSV
jgi:hypothetical protein